jgi:hypothetical protein
LAPRAATRAVTARRTSAGAARPSAGGRAEPFWANYDDERLLDVRMCDLGVTVEGSNLEPRLDRLRAELAGRGLEFRPHFWLSEEWFCPDGVPGIAIPFYLAHPRLARLEEKQTLEVEGGTEEWCLRILRHEAGHAIENAFHLRQRRRRQALFGRSSVPYPKFYLPRPYSRSFVVHLDGYYAQSHPDEDFAETFAVWLTPGYPWAARYAGWPALRKLEYVDAVMRELAGATPPVQTRRTVSPLSRIAKTLRAHYRDKRRQYGLDRRKAYDDDLLRLFTAPPGDRDRPSAAAFLSRLRPELRRRVARATGEYQYTIDRLLKSIIVRCRQLGLRLSRSEEETRLDFALKLTFYSMELLATGRHRVPL